MFISCPYLMLFVVIVPKYNAICSNNYIIIPHNFLTQCTYLKKTFFVAYAVIYKLKITLLKQTSTCMHHLSTIPVWTPYKDSGWWAGF